MDPWSALPPEILYLVFQHVPVEDLLLSVGCVCTHWYTITRHTAFWFRRLSLCGVFINKDLRSDLQALKDVNVLLQCLQVTCFYLQDLSHPLQQQNVGLLHFPDGGVWKITEELIHMATVFLMLRSPKLAVVELHSNTSFLTNISLLLTQLGNTRCDLHLDDQGSWRIPGHFAHCKTCEKILTYSFPNISRKFRPPGRPPPLTIMDDLPTVMAKTRNRCSLKSYRGTVIKMENLPSSLENLNLAIACDQQANACSTGLAKLKYTMPNLKEISMHVRVNVDVSCLPALPIIQVYGGSNVYLYLSGVGEAETDWATDAAKALLPRDGTLLGAYRWLVFPSSRLTRTTTEVLLRRLASAEVIVEGEIVVSSRAPVTWKHRAELNVLTKNLMPSCAGFIWRKSDDKLGFGW